MDIYILFRDMRTYGFKEDYYREAAEKDVKFIRYEPEDKPQVEAVSRRAASSLRVTVTDPILGKKLALDADLLALAAAVVPSGCHQGNSRAFQGDFEPGRLFQGSPCKAETGGFCHGRRLSVRNGPLSQAHTGNDQPGLWSRRPGA